MKVRHRLRNRETILMERFKCDVRLRTTTSQNEYDFATRTLVSDWTMNWDSVSEIESAMAMNQRFDSDERDLRRVLNRMKNL